MLTAPRPIQDPARRQGVALAVAFILLVSTLLRFWNLGTPPQMMFDEIYYAKDAKAIVDNRVGTHGQYRWAAGDEVSWPHPEAGKMAIALGILLFGDRSFGWRLPALVAGMGILACVYPIARRVGLSPPWALLALLFAAADPLGITQSRIATLDIFIAVWTVVCILCALRYVQDGWRTRWLVLCGVTGGLATATKWSGALALIAALLIIGFAWPLQVHAARRAAAGDDEDAAGGEVRPRRSPVPMTPPFAEQVPAAPPEGSTLRRLAQVVLCLVLLPVAVYLLSYTQYFLAGHTISDFIELHRQMLYFNLHLHATHTYASVAPTWIVDYRPVWYYFQSHIKYYGVIAIGNPFLWWMATLSLFAAFIVGILRRSYALLLVAGIVVVLYVPWFAATRTSFLYYMTPVAPFLAILVAAALCLFAGGVIPARGWIGVAVTALVTATLWQPIGSAFSWLFWGMPHRADPTLGAIALTLGVLLAVAVVIFLLTLRMRPYRPWTAMVLSGMIIGIVVMFVPIVLAIGISPQHWMHIMWFPKWI